MSQSAEDATLRPRQVRKRHVSELAHRLRWNLESDTDPMISGVTSRADRVMPGDLFVAIPGARHHGGDFASEALSRGAVAILTDPDGRARVADCDVPIATTLDPRSQLGLIAREIYAQRESDARLFAVTGTNGKTSVVYMLDALLRRLGRVTGISSTAERVIDRRVIVSDLTTPEADEMHAMIAVMGESGVTDIVVEVSAHALTRSRVTGLVFDVAAFTNFSQDHLDDYADMEEYFSAKVALFQPEIARRGVVCVDDAWSRRLPNVASIPLVTVASATSGDAVTADWTVTVLSSSPQLTRFQLSGPRGQILEAGVDMVGDFSAMNAALAIVMLVEAGVDLEAIRDALREDSVIRAATPGRMEIVSGNSGPLVFVDYGHTAEAFARTLSALRTLTPGRLIMVFGADGDRDTTKRFEMGRVAATGADVVVVTDFHPRSEDPAAIRSALMTGAVSAGSTAEIHEVPDQRVAVRFALTLAGEGDTVLYAGPGHETYQEVAGRKIPYDARGDTRLALAEAGWPPRENES